MKKKGKSPVIAGRVPQSLYLRIKRAAKKSGRSMSDEMAWRVAKSFEDEKIVPVLAKAGFAIGKELRELKQKLIDRSVPVPGSGSSPSPH